MYGLHIVLPIAGLSETSGPRRTSEPLNSTFVSYGDTQRHFVPVIYMGEMPTLARTHAGVLR